MRVWVFACAACWPSARATYLAVSLVVTPSRQSQVQSLPLPVVVVERGVTILHVAVFGFFPQFFAVVVRLRLLFVAALILDDVLPTTQTKQTGFTQGTVLKVERFKGR